MSGERAVTVWTGWDVRGGAAAAEGAASRFAPSLDKSIGRARYELLAVAGRGFRPPKFLSSVDTVLDDETDEPVLPDEEAAIADLGFREVWSLVYERVAETAPEGAAPFAIYLLGVNPPEQVSDEELVAFNAFYTDVHLREVAERRHALRATRYELRRALRPPYGGAPRFLAAYEVDEQGASVRRHVGPPYSAGPDVWQRHTTPWRLWYRRLGASGSKSA